MFKNVRELGNAMKGRSALLVLVALAPLAVIGNANVAIAVNPSVSSTNAHTLASRSAAALNHARVWPGMFEILSIACSSPGNCVGGGYKAVGEYGGEQAFLVELKNGVWGKAHVVPGIAKLNRGHLAEVDSVSCSSPGNCSAGGFYVDIPGPCCQDEPGGQPFVADETNGVWGKARRVPGIATLNIYDDASVVQISCASAGNCAAGGDYTTTVKKGLYQAWLADEVDGQWEPAKRISGMKAFGYSGWSQTYAVSCGSAGNCVAAGRVWAGHGDSAVTAWLVDEVNGQWGNAQEVPGIEGLNTGGYAAVSSVSCAETGGCSAGGSYRTPNNNFYPFVVSETGGSWGQAQEVPGFTALDNGFPYSNGAVSAVSCGSAGNCAALGAYQGSPMKIFYSNEVDGVWQTAHDIPGIGAISELNGGYVGVHSVSCAAAGECVAGGVLFQVTETGGAWGQAQHVPGSLTFNKKHGATVDSVSCPSVSYCALGGSVYVTRKRSREAFVATERR